MTNRDNEIIEKKLISILEDVFPSFEISEIDKDKRFVDQVPFDSIGQMTLLIQIKKRLGIVITQNDLSKIETYNGLFGFVVKNSQ